MAGENTRLSFSSLLTKLTVLAVVFLYLHYGVFSRTMGDIYKEHKDEDGFLYMIYANDEVYGAGDQ